MHAHACAGFVPGARMAAVFVAVSVVGLVTTVHAADADLDPSWGNSGMQEFAVADYSAGFAVAVQPDGKIVVAGSTHRYDPDFVVTRLTSEGELDTSFGQFGNAWFDFGHGWDEAHDVLIQPDGKIVLAGGAQGLTGQMFGVVRFNSDGSLDDYGFAYVSGHSAEAYGAALQSDGKIVLVGYVSDEVAPWDFAVARFTADLALDTSFASSGFFTWTSDLLADDCAYDVAIAGDGRIVAAGSGVVSGKGQMVVKWLNSTGGISASGASSFPDSAFGWGLALQSDDKPVVVGNTGANMAIARFLTNGQLDTSFNTDGMAVLSYSDSVAKDVFVQEDGKIVLGGYITQSGWSKFIVVRHLEDNGLDHSFNANPPLYMLPHTIYQIDPDEDAYAFGMALQPDGKILVTGYTGSGEDQNTVVTRHLGDETLVFADAFEWGSTAWWSTTKP